MRLVCCVVQLFSKFHKSFWFLTRTRFSKLLLCTAEDQCCDVRTECGDAHLKVLLLYGMQEMITGARVPSGGLELSVARLFVWPPHPSRATWHYCEDFWRCRTVKGVRVSQSDSWLVRQG